MTPEYVRVAAGGPMPDLGPEPYRALLVAEASVEADWRNRLSEHLVATGCLYFLAWGAHCSIWHDSVDGAVLEKFDFKDVPNDQFVMTTWHENEPLQETMWFAHFCASHGDIELQRFYVLHLAESAGSERLLSLYDSAINTPLDEQGYAPWDPQYRA